MFSGDENHIVMNDRVQALAGSIYEEFEQVREVKQWSSLIIYRTDYSDQKKKHIHRPPTKCGSTVPGTSESAECSWLLIDCDCEPVPSFFSSWCGSADNFFFFFFDQKLQFTGEALKKEHPALEKWNLLIFFYFCGSFLPSCIRIHSTAKSLHAHCSLNE